MDRNEMMRLLGQCMFAMHRPAVEAALARIRAGVPLSPSNAAETDTEAATVSMSPSAAAAPARGRSVAVMSVHGVLTMKGPQDFFDFLFGGVASTEQLAARFRGLVADDGIGAIVLDFDSPGGEVYGTPEFAEVIYQARGSKPIVAQANPVAFSAAYWLASQADEVVVTPSGEVGSVGVWQLHADASKFWDEMGVDWTYIYAGKYKVLGNDTRPLEDDEKDLIQARIDGYYRDFVDAVARGRGVKAADVRAGFGQGWIVRAKEAKTLGMVDRVGTLEETVARLAGSRPSPGARANAAGAGAEISAEADLELRERSRRLSRAGR